MTPSQRGRVLRGLGLVTVGLIAGFVAGRRSPRSRDAETPAERPTAAWVPVTQAPLARYEAAGVLIGGQLYVFGGFFSEQIRATPRVDVFDLASRRWTRKADMALPITHANAAILRDTVWLAGGFVGDSPGAATDQVRRYDPAHDSWSLGPSLPEPRGGGALVNLDGRLHYFGGWKPDRATDSEDHWVLEPGASSWQRAAPLPHPRGHLAGVALDGKLYAIGGCVGHDPVPVDVGLVHRYDPRTDTWEEVAPLPTPRSHIEVSTFVQRDRIVVIGGRSRPSRWANVPDVSAYDPVTNRWTALASLPLPLLAPIAVAVGDSALVGAGSETNSNPQNLTFWIGTPWAGWAPADPLPAAAGGIAAGVIGTRLYLVGERNPTTFVLDLGSGHWAPRTSHAMRPSFRDASGAEVLGGKFYLFGGSGDRAGLLQIYDPDADAWRVGPPIPFPAIASASAVIAGRLYVAGGSDGGRPATHAAVYDPVAQRWTPVASLPQPRSHAASGTDGTRLFLFGGEGPGAESTDSGSRLTATVQVYDPATGHWTISDGSPGSPAPLPEPRARMGRAVYYRGEFYLVGGVTAEGAGPVRTSERVDVYDPVANTWRSGPPMPTPRRDISPVLQDGRIYVAGGGTRGGPWLSPVMEVLVP